MPKSNKQWAWRISFDVACLLIVGFSVLAFYLAGRPFERGFYCDNDSIRYPYHHGTISSTVLYSVGFALNMVAMSIVEYFHCKHCHRQKTMEVCRLKVHPWFWAIYQMVGVFAFGAACSQLATDIGKYSIGRLRPHFIAVCKPDVLENGSCTDHTYITNFKCLGPDEKAIREARLSFPSGHASFSFYTMVYLALYLQARLTWRATKLLRPFLQFVCLMLCWYTALSRVSDYKHHPTDVLAGAVLGAIVAVLVAVFVSGMFKRRCAAADIAPVSRQNTVNNSEPLQPV
ncbi:putative phosphatidate phosphatase isoform X3 [Amphibalanus amphitrite]|uniref:putative phosphatidate phosphatase isoform X3 n=1 Tax=Amphibalanus amphitrite TaxID=1232801 RepID=UPI001C92B87A|nr:putative phosphatidate phosphatase isoform X3 [Amphibalanus amphitrite]